MRQFPRVGQEAGVDPEWEEHDVNWQFKTPFYTFGHVPAGDPIDRYLGFGQNDAYVLGAELREDEFLITLNHYDVWRLACMLDDRQNSWTRYQRSFPVTLHFSGLADLVAIRTIEQGSLMKLRCSQRNISRNLYDLIGIKRIDDRHYLFAANGRVPFQRRGPMLQPYVNGYYFGIECEWLHVEERYREGWLQAFAGKHLDVLEEFDTVWPQSGWAVPDFEKWLEENGFAMQR